MYKVHTKFIYIYIHTKINIHLAILELKHTDGQT